MERVGKSIAMFQRPLVVVLGDKHAGSRAGMTQEIGERIGSPEFKQPLSVGGRDHGSQLQEHVVESGSLWCELFIRDCADIGVHLVGWLIVVWCCHGVLFFVVY
jgi:hypothetical protein